MRVRIAIAAVSLVIATLLAIGWYRSRDGFNLLTYRWRSILPPASATADPATNLQGCWEVRASSLSFLQAGGRVEVSWCTYSSFDPTREAQIDRWKDWSGFHTDTGASDGDECCCSMPPFAQWESPLEWRLGRFRAESFQGIAPGRSFAVPHWFLILGCLAPSARAGLIAWRTARRVRSGRCRACGYLPPASAATCPECGKLLREVAPPTGA